ncbi:MAG TPA: hypothetical protein DDZ80_10095 [Cyanobacteria bacterium UBA8803]|nr:hypothetical protein [Cyanobacteria bacterium UBA9273]HBL58843.1 hypothetical protein [Cyanobacteria bacterium UBA8803]
MKALVSCDRNLLWFEQSGNSDALVPLKYVTQINGEALSESISSEFVIKYIDIGSVDSTGRISQIDEFTFVNSPSRARRRVKQGDTIVSTVRTYLKAIAYIDQDESSLIASTGFAVLSAIPSILYPRYLYYWMRSDFIVDEICARSVGVSYPATNASEIGSIPIPTPPIEQQKSIASFLDRKTAAIDTLIAKKQRLIQLLEEKRTALINQAVTKGLNPNAPMKYSGIPWIGESIDCITELALQETSIKIIQPPVVLVVVRGMILAHSFPVALTTSPLTINQDMKALACSGKTIAEFLARQLSACRDGVLSLIQEAGHGTKALRTDLFEKLLIVLPPIKEQKEICSFANNEAKKFASIITCLNDQIEKLQEYRRSLITSAVTGQLEISEVEPDV